MWRKVAIQPVVQQEFPAAPPQPQLTPQQELALLLLPRARRPRTLRPLRSSWAPTSLGSTTRAASFFQHVSATSWLRAS
jgi:hypothetical protein